MKLFSERYGYTKASDVIITERITPEIQNAICSCYDLLHEDLPDNIFGESDYSKIEINIWSDFFNKRIKDYKHTDVIGTIVNSASVPWFRKLDLIEFTIKHSLNLPKYKKERTNFINNINLYFKRLNFGYKIISYKIVEITSKEEVESIEKAIEDSTSNIKMHLNKALELYSKKPIGDYSNSIKESISALEAYCREKTNKNTLGDALNALESSGLKFPKLLKDSFVKMYAYTNNPETGIRHALMDSDSTYTPSSEEALYMLVSCSTFINYLRKKSKSL